MNELEHTLSTNMGQMASLKQDLMEVTALLEEKPVDSGNILQTMHERE